MPRVSSSIPSLLVTVALLVACVPGSAGQPTEDQLSQLSPGWNVIAGGPGTGCAFDTSFSFFVHPGDPKRLAIYLQGGGACWNGENCDVQGRPTFDPIIDSTDFPPRGRGMANLESEANPIRGFSIVFIPYCTGDVHLGTRTVTYTSRATAARPARSYTIHHWGGTNASRALSWTFAHFPSPDLVFVSGSSAGAIPSPLYAAQVAARYPRARVVQLGDGAGGYRAREITQNLGPAGALEFARQTRGFQTLDTTNFSFEALYSRAARAAPRVAFAQFNNAEDSTQVFFLRELGHRDVSLPPLLEANLADIRRDNPRFRSYTAPGATHTILGRPLFYTLEVDGVRFRDWLAELIQGQEVGNVGERLLGGGR